MMLFSTGTELERVRIVGLELELPLGQSLAPDAALPAKTSDRGGQRGLLPLAAPMPNSVSFL